MVVSIEITTDINKQRPLIDQNMMFAENWLWKFKNPIPLLISSRVGYIITTWMLYVEIWSEKSKSKSGHVITAWLRYRTPAINVSRSPTVATQFLISVVCHLQCLATAKPSRCPLQIFHRQVLDSLPIGYLNIGVDVICGLPSFYCSKSTTDILIYFWPPNRSSIFPSLVFWHQIWRIAARCILVT